MHASFGLTSHEQPLRAPTRVVPGHRMVQCGRRARSRHPAATMAGCLLVVATPIGNLEDITLRALRVLREADLIAAEDTRRTARLLQHYPISTPTTSLHEHNEGRRITALLGRLAEGSR